MRIGIIGAGHIGGNIGQQAAARSGHEVLLSFARDAAKLESLAKDPGGSAGTPADADAVAFGDVVVISVPWSAVPFALEQAGSLQDKVVIDTTNQFGSGLMPVSGETAAAFNKARMPGARYVKCFNTLTSAFQAATASRAESERVVQWICGDDEGAKEIVARLVLDMGYTPVDLGGTETCAVMEAPRRQASVYGEEYRLTEAQAVVEAVRSGRPIPPTPHHGS